MMLKQDIALDFIQDEFSNKKYRTLKKREIGIFCCKKVPILNRQIVIDSMRLLDCLLAEKGFILGEFA